MTEEKKPIQPERAVATIRKRAQTAADRKDRHLANLGREFDRRETEFQVATITRVSEPYRESTRAMLAAMQIHVPIEQGEPAETPAEPTAELPGARVIDSEFDEAAEAEDDAEPVVPFVKMYDTETRTYVPEPMNPRLARLMSEKPPERGPPPLMIDRSEKR